MGLTVQHSLTMTTPDDPAYENKPSDWNKSHLFTLNAVGSEISGAFSNGGNVSFGLETNGFITATANAAGAGDGFNRIAAGTQTAGTNATIVFSNSNGVSFGMSNSSVVTASHNGLTSQSNQALSAANGSFTFQTATFANSNGVSFSTGTQGIFASHNGITSQTNQSLGWYATSNTTQSSSGTMDARSITVQANGGLSAGVSNGSLVISSPPTSELTVSGFLSMSTAGNTMTIGAGPLSFYATGNTTQSSSGTIDGRSITVNGAGVASVGVTNGSLMISVPSGGGAGDGVNILAAGTQTAATTGTVLFQNSNGITFGMSNSSVITASHNGLTSQSNQAWSGSNASSTFQTLSFNNANGVSWSNNAGAVEASYTRPVVSNAIQSVGSATNSGTNTSRFAADDHVHAGVFSVGVSTGGNTAGDTRVDVGRFVLAGGANITLSQATAANGLNTISIVGGAGGAGDGVNILAAGTQTANTTGTVVLSDSNGISFGMSNSSVITASYTVPSTVGLISAVKVSAGTTSNNLSALTFADSNGISFGLNASTITGTVRTDYASSVHGHTLTASATGNTTQSSSGTLNMGGFVVAGSGIASVGVSNNSIIVSATQSNQAFSAGGGSSAFQTLSFADTNGVSWTNTNGSVGATVRTDYASSVHGHTITAFATSNTTQSSTGTINMNSLIFAGAGIASVGVTNGSVVVSVPSGGGAGDGGVFAGVSTAGNTAGSTGTVSTGNFILVGSGPISLSQSTGAAGSAATITINAPATSSIVGTNELSVSTNGSTIYVYPIPNSAWDNAHINGYISVPATAQANSIVSIQPFQLQWPLAVSNFRAAASFNVGSAANNSSAFMDVSMSGVVYTRTGSTLSSVLSFSNSMTQTWSSNATGTVTGVIALTATFGAATLMPDDYWIALHVSTTNTATGGAATTALGHTLSMVNAQSVGSAAILMKQWGAQTATSQGLISGQGMLSTGATRASIAFSDYTVTGTRQVVAPFYFGLRNATYQG